MPTTGAAHGRAGGKIGAGKRARYGLARAPRITVVEVKPSTAGNKRKRGETSEETQALSGMQQEALQIAATQMSTQLGLNAHMASIVQAAMLAGAASSSSLQPVAPSSAATPTTNLSKKAAGKQRVPAAAQASSSTESIVEPAVGAAPVTPAPNLQLRGHPRGSTATIKLPGTYGGYTFDDICKVLTRVRNKEITIHMRNYLVSIRNC